MPQSVHELIWIDLKLNSHSTLKLILFDNGKEVITVISETRS